MRPRLSPERQQRGSLIIEICLGWGVLLVIASLMLRAHVNLTSAQRWTIVQAMTDASMSRESALANRVPFDELIGNDTLWPTYPSVATQTMDAGKLPGGVPVVATILRTKFPDANNLSEAGGEGDGETNPAQMEAWKLQSLLSYQISGRDYVKSRTILRIR